MICPDCQSLGLCDCPHGDPGAIDIRDLAERERTPTRSRFGPEIMLVGLFVASILCAVFLWWLTRAT